MFVGYLVKNFQKWKQTKSHTSLETQKDEDIDPELELKFESAASRLPILIPDLTRTCVLQFYGLYKQATEGPPESSSRPSWYDSAARYKFDAWFERSNLSRNKAMELYCEKLADLDPTWDFSVKSKGSGWSMKPSTMMMIEPEMFDDFVQMDPVGMESDTEKKWFESMRSDDVGAMREILDQNPGILEAKDQHLAMTALSRSIDLGCERVAAFLISAGADVNVKDHEGQTPLHFAAQCHRHTLAEVLIAAGADRRARDSDGNTPAQCCDDPALIKLLSL